MNAAMQQPGRKPHEQPPRGSLLRTVKAVAWSFMGLRRGKDFQDDVERLSPIHIIVAGFIGVVVLVAALIGLVFWVAG